MVVGQLLQLLIAASVLLLHCLRCTKSTSCSTCMANILGPQLENETPNNVETVRVNESDPVIIVCRYVCHDSSDYARYNFDLRIDILDPRLQIQRRRTISTRYYEDDDYNFRASLLTYQTCSQMSNEAITKYQIYVGSRDTPTLIAKCFVTYSPNAPSVVNSTRCSNTSTFAIEPAYPAPTLNFPSSSELVDSSTCIRRTETTSPSPACVSPTVQVSTVTATVMVSITIPGPNVSTLSKNDTCNTHTLHEIYGSTLGMVCLVMTVVIVILTVALVIKCTKYVQCQNERENEQQPIAGEPGNHRRRAWN